MTRREQDPKGEQETKKKKTRRGGWFAAALVLLLAAGAFWLLVAGQVAPRGDHSQLNILVIGSDENEALGITGRADTIMVAHIGLDAPEIYILSIPRDTLVNIEGHGDTKINHAYAYGGVELLAETVEELLGQPLDYYALTDFSGFEGIVDILGGVEIDVDKRMYYQTYDGLIDIEAGLQRLDGVQALQYVRFRQDELGDITRVSRQQIFLKALASQLLEQGVLRKLPPLLAEMDQVLETDMPLRYMPRLAMKLRHLDVDTLESGTLPGDFADIDGVSYWQADGPALEQLLAEHF